MSTVAAPRPGARRKVGTRVRAGVRTPTKKPTSARSKARSRTQATTRSSSTVMLLATTVAVLNLVGVVMVLSASSVASLTDYGSPWYFFLRQLLWTVVGIAAFVVAIRFDYHQLRRFVRPLLILSTVLLVVVLIPGIGVYVSGSRRWLGAGMFRFQPTELAKFALLLYAADLASRRAREIGDWRRVVKPVLIVLGAFGFLVMREPDLGSALVLVLIVATVLVAAGSSPRHLGVVALGAASIVTILAIAEPYRRARLLTFLHPFADQTNAGYQISQSLIAIGSGGLTGVGLGAGRAKWNFLPNAHTDFIFAIISEELGLIGGLLVIALFIGFAVLGIRVALRAPDRFGALLAAGITMGIVGQAVINIGAVVGLLPITGIPLPFVSFGGTALITTMFSAGVLANIGRQIRPTSVRAVSATFALVTGGGTGGHVYPALALADELVRRGHARDSIRFVGSARGLEVTAVPEAGYAIDVLPGRGFDRARTRQALTRNLRTAWDTVVALARAIGIVRRTRPAVVVGVGGYASLPTLLAGRLQRIPAVIHEADAHPGLANRIAVRFGARPAVSLPDTPLPGAVVTGNPIRPEIVAVERAPVTPPVVAVVGGSLGAQRINLAAIELYGLWRARDDVVIHHVTGARGYEECRERLASARAPGDRLDYRLIRYEDHMDTLYANATLMLCRSGGMTAELAVVGMPSVLVPLPDAPGDHQTRNAEVFARAGAAVMVPDRELDGPRLARELDTLLADPSRLLEMEQAARSLGRTDATARFADLVEEVARGTR